MIPFIGLASGLGGGDPGSFAGPLLIKKQFIGRAEWKAMISADPAIGNKIDQISLLNKKLATETYDYAKSYPFTVVIGGDHSCALGTWSGISEAKRAIGKDIALIWFDAHMDAHTFETSQSGNIHGMPLAALLGYGSRHFTEILSATPKLKAENVFLIGARSYETGERQLLERLGVNIYYMEEILQQGLKPILAKILAGLSAKKLPYGITLDIDFFDPTKIGATGTPVAGGVDPEEFRQCSSLFKALPPIAFELVEFDPARDDSQNTSLQEILVLLECVVAACAPCLAGRLEQKCFAE